jgi:hypothetical protein
MHLPTYLAVIATAHVLCAMESDLNGRAYCFRGYSLEETRSLGREDQLRSAYCFEPGSLESPVRLRARKRRGRHRSANPHARYGQERRRCRRIALLISPIPLDNRKTSRADHDTSPRDLDAPHSQLIQLEIHGGDAQIYPRSTVQQKGPRRGADQRRARTPGRARNRLSPHGGPRLLVPSSNGSRQSGHLSLERPSVRGISRA